MSGVSRGSPLERPVVVRMRIVEPSFQMWPTSPSVSRYRRTCALPYSLVASSVDIVPPYLRCGTFHACETRNGRDVIHLRAMADVFVEPGWAVGSRVQACEGIRPRGRERR